MRADHWLGVHLRRLGVVTGILHTREEQEVRDRHHGGSVADLNARVAARSAEVARTVAKYESKL